MENNTDYKCAGSSLPSPPLATARPSIQTSKLPGIQYLLAFKPEPTISPISPGGSPTSFFANRSHAHSRSFSSSSSSASESSFPYSNHPMIPTYQESVQEQQRRIQIYQRDAYRVASQTATRGLVPAKSTIRFDNLKNGTSIKRTCGDCSADQTSGHWCSDPITIGGFICQKCYRRRKRVTAIGRSAAPYAAKNRSCHKCQSYTSSVWFKHDSLGAAYVCHSCHSGEAVSAQNSCCSACGSLKSTKWSVIGDGSIVCRKCTRQLVNANKMDPSYLDGNQSYPVAASSTTPLAGTIARSLSMSSANSSAPSSIYDLLN